MSRTGFLHRFFDYDGRETDFTTWQRLRDDVGAEWAQDNHTHRGVFVSTCFRGFDYDGEVVLWETRVTRLPDAGFVAGRYSSHDDAVRGHVAILEAESHAK